MAIKGSAVIYAAHQAGTPNSVLFDCWVTDDAAHESQMQVGPYAQNQLTTLLMIAIKADIKAFMVANYGTVFGLLDTIRIAGNLVDL